MKIKHFNCHRSTVFKCNNFGSLTKTLLEIFFIYICGVMFNFLSYIRIVSDHRWERRELQGFREKTAAKNPEEQIKRIMKSLDEYL